MNYDSIDKKIDIDNDMIKILYKNTNIEYIGLLIPNINKINEKNLSKINVIGKNNIFIFENNKLFLIGNVTSSNKSLN